MSNKPKADIATLQTALDEATAAANTAQAEAERTGAAADKTTAEKAKEKAAKAQTALDEAKQEESQAAAARAAAEQDAAAAARPTQSAEEKAAEKAARDEAKLVPVFLDEDGKRIPRNSLLRVQTTGPHNLQALDGTVITPQPTVELNGPDLRAGDWYTCQFEEGLIEVVSTRAIK